MAALLKELHLKFGGGVLFRRQDSKILKDISDERKENYICHDKSLFVEAYDGRCLHGSWIPTNTHHLLKHIYYWYVGIRVSKVNTFLKKKTWYVTGSS